MYFVCNVLAADNPFFVLIVSKLDNVYRLNINAFVCVSNILLESAHFYYTHR